MSQYQLTAKDVSELTVIVQALVDIATFSNRKEWICNPAEPEISGTSANELFAPVPYIDWCHGNIFQEKMHIGKRNFYSHCTDTADKIIRFLSNGDDWRDNDVPEERIKMFELTTLFPIYYYNKEEDKDKSYYRNWVVWLGEFGFYFADNQLYKEGE